MVTVYGILNVVTGIFVESAMLTAKTDRHLIMMEDQETKRSYMERMKALFEAADKDKSGTISWREFQAHVQTHRMKSYFALLGLDISEAKNLFQLLDVDSSDEISI